MPPVRPETPGHPFRDADAPAPSTDPFLLVVEDVFSITGRGTVVTGPVNRGTLRVGDHVEILGLGGPPIATTVTGIEMFRKLLDEATVGANVGLLLRDVARDAIWRGRAVVAPRSRTDRRAVHVELDAEAAARLPGDGAVRCQWYSARVDARVVRGESPGRSGVAAVRVELGSPLPLEPGDELVLWSGRDALGPAIVVAGLE